MSAQNPPAEVLGAMFQQLSREDVGQCMFVCKSWFAPSIQEYCKVISLSSHTGAIIHSKLRQRNTSFGLNYGYWVNKLDIRNTVDTDSLEPEDLAKLLTYLPNVKKITFYGGAAQYDKYFNILHNVADGQECLQQIQELSISEKYNAFQLTEDTMKSYFSLCYKLRKTITSLLLSRIGQQYSINDQQSGSFLHFLPDFTHLTHLTICNTPHSNSDINVCMISILKVCPNLIKFDFKSEFPAPPYTIDNSASTMSCTHPHLKYIYLNMPQIANSYMDYIISNVNPTQLDMFDLLLDGFTNFEFGDWSKGYDNTDKANAFGRHLDTVKNLHIHSINWGVTPNVDDEDTIILDNYLENNSRFWQFVKAIKGIRNLYVRAELEIKDNNEVMTAPSIDIRVDDNEGMKVAYITHALWEDFDQVPMNYLIPIESSNKETELKLIDSLSIYASVTEGAEYSLVQLLHAALYKFPLLSNLYIKFQSTEYSYIRIMLPGNQRFDIIPKNLYNWNEEDNSFIMKHKDLNQLLLARLPLSSTLLKIITDALPQIQLIECSRCELVFDENHNTTFNLKNMKKLGHMELEIKNIQFKKYRCIFIEFQLSGKKSVCYRSEKVQESKTRYAFVLSDRRYIQQYNRFKSSNTLIITIICDNILKFTLSDAQARITFVFTPGVPDV